MRFKIHSKTLDNKDVIHFYDNISQEIQTEKGIPVVLKDDPRCTEMLKKFNWKEENGPITNNLRSLRIQIGLNCNFSCKYCNQRHGSALDKQAVSEVKLPDSVRVKNFIKLLKENDIKTEQIALWGGEPFVYIKLLKILVPELRKLYPDIPISTISNGSLINKDIIDFCLEHRIALTISHDAQAFTVYRNDKNPLDDPKIVKELIRYMDAIKNQPNIWFGINTVVVPENCDLFAIDQYFFEKFNRKVSWHFEGIAKLDCESQYVINPFTEESKKILLNSLFKFGLMDPDKRIANVRDMVSKYLSWIINQCSPLDKLIPCDVEGSRILATTLDGNILACHGASKEQFTVGYLKDLGTVRNNKVISWQDRNNCPDCPYVLFCAGGCAIASNEDSEAACENLKLWYTGIFAAVWFHLFNSVIQSIEPIE